MQQNEGCNVQLSMISGDVLGSMMNPAVSGYFPWVSASAGSCMSKYGMHIYEWHTPPTWTDADVAQYMGWSLNTA